MILLQILLLPGKSFPDGVDVEVFHSILLKLSIGNVKKIGSWACNAIFGEKDLNFMIDLKENLSKYRFTLDYEEDLILIKILLNFNKSKKKINMGNVVDF